MDTIRLRNFFLNLDRSFFIDNENKALAHIDSALPIGFGQTISAPLTVARMLEIARAGRALGKVLEIGTGCGYQAAVLSRVARAVYSVERIASLLGKAREPMSCKDMIAAMTTKGLWTSPAGETPDATLYASILRDLRKGKDSRFVKAGPGRFALNR